ncbi:hypothetical protein [Caulobacter sp. BE254]|uniref:hypothetical protein n=1 Tax=Caulobacter sp. BE254 TaxID=2817720 RepID=UPI00285C8BAF|nr:hypothetical protein [Caulobacter sp. BE254]MDR7114518.1 chitinase [Caulobacter sp. BE254]
MPLGRRNKPVELRKGKKLAGPNAVGEVDATFRTEVEQDLKADKVLLHRVGGATAQTAYDIDQWIEQRLLSSAIEKDGKSLSAL